MPLRYSFDARVRAAWQTQLTTAKQTPGLLQLLMQQRHNLLPRFAAAYDALRTLPRRLRRHLQRHWRQSLAGLALGLALGQGGVLADTIDVDGTTCTLINAIVTANTDSDTGGCVQTGTSEAADTLMLQHGSIHTLTAVDNNTYGPTGLPVINSEITIAGDGSTIRRSGGAPSFRILAVNAAGNLTLKETTIRGGIASGGSAPDDRGGGIFTEDGTVTLVKSTVSGSSAF